MVQRSTTHRNGYLMHQNFEFRLIQLWIADLDHVDATINRARNRIRQTRNIVTE